MTKKTTELTKEQQAQRIADFAKQRKDRGNFGGLFRVVAVADKGVVDIKNGKNAGKQAHSFGFKAFAVSANTNDEQLPSNGQAFWFNELIVDNQATSDAKIVDRRLDMHKRLSDKAVKSIRVSIEYYKDDRNQNSVYSIFERPYKNKKATKPVAAANGVEIPTDADLPF